MKDRVDEIRNYICEKFRIIDKIEDSVFQSVCLFTLLDCFAQEYNNYPHGKNNTSFCKFIKDFAENSSVIDLEKFDPITLYYRCEKLKNSCSLDDLLDDTINYTLNGMQSSALLLSLERECYNKRNLYQIPVNSITLLLMYN